MGDAPVISLATEPSLMPADASAYGAPLPRWVAQPASTCQHLVQPEPQLGRVGRRVGPSRTQKASRTPTGSVDTIRSGTMADEGRTGSGGTDRPATAIGAQI